MSVPLQVSVPAIKLVASVVPVGVRTGGELIVPPPQQVGWWTGGAEPGSTTGSTVLAGHVDTADGQPGAFYHLSALKPGAAVQLQTTAGLRAYKIAALRTYPRDELPAAIFDRAGPHRLVLVTCGGSYDNGYTRNVVVYALPAA